MADRDSAADHSFTRNIHAPLRSAAIIYPANAGLFFLEKTIAKKPKLLSDLFHDTLKDVYFAENKNSKNATENDQGSAIQGSQGRVPQAERESGVQIKQLQGVFKILGKKPQAKTCEAIMGITKEGAEIMTTLRACLPLDAGLLLQLKL